MSNKAAQRDLAKQASECLKDHQYKQLASWGGGSEVWECSKPGTSVYAFTIAVTRMGISVVGDIGGLMFKVGSNYGMSFLAGDDLSYYIKSKLEHLHLKEVELDRDRLLETVAQNVMEHLFGDLSDQDQKLIEGQIGEQLSEEVFDSYKVAENPEACRVLIDKICDCHIFLEDCYGSGNLDMNPADFQKCLELYQEAEGVDGTHAAYELLSDFELRRFEMVDVSIEKPTESLMFRLHMVNQAAKQIVALKAALEPQEESAGPGM